MKLNIAIPAGFPYKQHKHWRGAINFFAELDEEEKALHEEEQIYWRDYCEHHKALLDFDDNHERLLFKLLGY